MAHVLLRLPEVLRRSGDSKSTYYLRVQQGLWTRPIALGPRTKAHPDYEVDELLAARIAGKSNDELRLLVLRLEAARKTLPSRFDQGSIETASQGG